MWQENLSLVVNEILSTRLPADSYNNKFPVNVFLKHAAMWLNCLFHQHDTGKTKTSPPSLPQVSHRYGSKLIQKSITNTTNLIVVSMYVCPEHIFKTMFIQFHEFVM